MSHFGISESNVTSECKLLGHASLGVCPVAGDHVTEVTLGIVVGVSGHESSIVACGYRLVYFTIDRTTVLVRVLAPRLLKSMSGSVN